MLLGCAPARAVSAAGAHGLWLLPRKDTGNTARADVPGNMKSAPREVWHYGGGAGDHSYIAPVTVKEKEAYLLQSRTRLLLQTPDGGTVWSNPRLGVENVIDVSDFDGDGATEALVTCGTRGFALVEVATGTVRWNWAVPVGAAVGSYKILRTGKAVLLISFPMNTIQGFALNLSRSKKQPVIAWQHTYTNTYWQGFGPAIVLADMDKDGKAEIVLAGKPGYVAVINPETGDVKFDLHYEIAGGDHIGRPYGLLQAANVDGDGYCDVAMISCQVEEYAAVVHNEGGKSFRLLWSQFIEKDLPDDFRELRPNLTSLADVNGEGRKELVLGLFNLTGDNRWHTLVLDAEKGLKSPLADLPDRYCWGCYDLNGDGRPEIITSTEKVRKFAESSTLQAVDGKTMQDLGVVERATLMFGGSRMPDDTGFMAIRHTPLWLTLQGGEAGLVLRNALGKAGDVLWRIENGKSILAPLRLTPTALAVAKSAGADRIENPDRVLQHKAEGGGVAASAPLVCEADGKRELVMALSDGTIVGGTPDFATSGKLRRSWTVPGAVAAVWIGPKGERVVCSYDKGTVHVTRPVAGAGTRGADVEIRPPNPLYTHSATRSGATFLPFGRQEMRLFLGLQTGVHTLASALYGADGRQLWLDATEGPYPRSAAVVEAAGNEQPSLIVDNHGKHLLYDMAGRSRLLAHGWFATVPGRSDGTEYALPIVGPFGPEGETRIVMSPGLDALETLDATGKRLARRPFASSYEFDWCGSAVGKIRGTGAWDIAIVSRDGLLHCVDIGTCQTRWTIDLGCTATSPINVVSGDLDGDGRDNFLVGLPNGDLVALDERNGTGVVLWKLSLDAGIREAILADVDGDGFAEVVVETEDGYVRILKGSAKR